MPTTAVIYDLEFTAWTGSMSHRWLRPGEFKEIVQIGAVKVDAVSMKIVGEFDAIVRPRINSALSPYFEKLTGISNDALKTGGVDLAVALTRFVAFCGSDMTSAFGRDDLVIGENIRLYGLKDIAPAANFIDLRPWFRSNGLDSRGLHSCDVGPRLGVPFEGHTHNALADSRSLAAGARVLVGKGAPSPFYPALAGAKTAA
jgi:inhibitor of KinA sporulation pathway (predicted exonuclease)